METKLFEVRDRMTFIPVMATKLEPRNEAELFLYRHGGYALGMTYVMLTRLSGDNVVSDFEPFAWNDRTMKNAHLFIVQKWDKLNTGDVIDVEFILGETAEPKQSERLTT